MNFTSKIFCLTLNDEIRYNLISNEYYINIIKFIDNKDDDGLALYFNNIIYNILEDKQLYNKLNILDKFLILLDIRINLLGDKLSFKLNKLNNDNKSSIQVSCNSVKKNLIEKMSKKLLTDEFSDDILNIIFNIPINFNTTNVDSLYNNLIYSIKCNDICIEFNNITDKEKSDIVNNLPANISNKIFDYISYITDITKEVNIMSGNSKLGMDNIPLNLLDNTLFMFLKSIFTDELMNMYELQYNMIHKLNITYDHFLKMTPLECKIFINFYNNDMKKQEEAQNKANSGYGSMPKFG